jgi:hypothetical protein
MRTYLLAVAVFCLAALAQEPTGTILGRITDRSGAVIPGATTTATNLATNVVVRASSNMEGYYELAYLLPGQYKLEAGAAGFKTSTRSDIDLRMGARLLVDIELDIGAVTEVVEVSAKALVLESASGGLGQSLDARQFSSLPLRSGSVASLYAMSPGVVWSRIPYDGPWNPDDSATVSVAGGGSMSMDFNLDGVSNNSYNGGTAFVPPPDMVSDVRINTANYDAAVGHTTGGSVNVSLKSGTNRLHGSLGTSVSSGPMMTRNFFTDQFIYNPQTGPITPAKIKANTPAVRWLRQTAVVGGPVLIPHVYDGRNKTFFIFGYQRHYRLRAISNNQSVPTAAGLGGDLSALLAVGPQYQIYDPLTTTSAGGGRYRRTPLANNIVPSSRIDPMARKIGSYYPAPNQTGTADGLNNYSATFPNTQDLSQPMVRVDQYFSEKNRFFARYTETDFTGHFDMFVPNSKVRGRYRQRPSRGVAMDDVMVLSSSMVLDLRYGFTWFREHQYYDNQGWDVAGLGFSPSLISQLDPAGFAFPRIDVDGHLELGNDGGWNQGNYSHSLLGVLTWTRGKHSFRFGFDGRLLYETYKTYGDAVPQLVFGSTYTNGPLDNAPGAPTGQGVASFLLGIPSGGGADFNDSFADATHYYSPFVQDDWRVTPKLTLNLGLRWEYEGPPTERFNRSSRQFDFDVVNPIQTVAQAQYAKSPIPEIPVSQFQTLGGLTFAGAGGNPRAIRDPYWRALNPRFGFAYQLRPAVVLRGGYGIFFGLLGVEYTNAAQPGFSLRTNVVASQDNGITYSALIANPLPNGLTAPLGAAGGLNTFLGRSPGFFVADGRRPYTQRWSFTLQAQPLHESVFEVGYLGSRSVHQRITQDFNPVPARYLSTLPVRDQATINFFSAQVANPFVGIAGFAGSPLYSTTNTNRAQLLRPYPEFGSLTTGTPDGFTWYHALTARFERRFSHGLQFQAIYTFSKTMQALGYLNPTDAGPEHVIASLDRPHRLALTSVVELPFGSGRRFGRSLKGIGNHVIGGWGLNIIYQFQSGAPLAFGNVILRGTYDQLALPNRSPNQWFNTQIFERNSSAQLANNIRVLSSNIAAVRADGMNILDLAVHKRFRIREYLNLELRGEGEGILNHPNLSAPNLNPANTLFGQVTATQTNQEERRVFVGLKLIF